MLVSETAVMVPVYVPSATSPDTSADAVAAVMLSEAATVASCTLVSCCADVSEEDPHPVTANIMLTLNAAAIITAFTLFLLLPFFSVIFILLVGHLFNEPAWASSPATFFALPLQC